MRSIGTLALCSALLFSAVPAKAAQPAPTLQNVATTDDCFSSYSDAGKHCELNYCLNTVLDQNEPRKVNEFQACTSRTIAGLQMAEEKSSQ